MGMLADGQRWLTDRKLQHDGVNVRYRRGLAQKLVRVYFGTGSLAVHDATADMQVGKTERSFLLDPAALQEFYPPQRGDRIVYVIGTKRYTEEVDSPMGLDCWTWSDPTESRSRIRVHTKLILVEDI